MSKLTEFLTEHADIGTIEQEVAISPRFKDEKGNILKFKIKPMSGEEFGRYQKLCTTINMTGKKRETQFDSGKFNVLVITNHCIDPDFKNAAWLKELGVINAEMAVQKVLLAGEIIELGNKITNLSGFDVDINEEIDEAKN